MVPSVDHACPRCGTGAAVGTIQYPVPRHPRFKWSCAVASGSGLSASDVETRSSPKALASPCAADGQGH